MIKGIEIIPLKRYNDERGYFLELFRSDNPKIVHEIVQFNMSYSYLGIIRAWHRHLRDQFDYFTCIDGCLKICAYDDRKNSKSFRELDEFILRGDDPQILRVPGILWHGFKVIGPNPAKLLYGVNKLYDYENPDEERRPWNDPTIIPESINGNINDPRVGKSWDWNYPPYK